MHHGIPWCLPLVSFRLTWRSFHAFSCRWSRLLSICVVASQSTSQIITWVLFTLPYSSRNHAPSMFFTGRLIYRMVLMIFLALAGVALLGVGWRGILSYLNFPSMTDMVGICPNGCFIRCYPFVDLLWNFHAFWNVSCCLVDITLKVPALYIGLLCSDVGDCME